VNEFGIMDRRCALRGTMPRRRRQGFELKNAVAQKSREVENTEGQYTATEIHAPQDGVVIDGRAKAGKPRVTMAPVIPDRHRPLRARSDPLPAKPGDQANFIPANRHRCKVLDLPKAWVCLAP